MFASGGAHDLAGPSFAATSNADSTGDPIERWVGSGLLVAERQFRKVIWDRGSMLRQYSLRSTGTGVWRVFSVRRKGSSSARVWTHSEMTAERDSDADWGGYLASTPVTGK